MLIHIYPKAIKGTTTAGCSTTAPSINQFIRLCSQVRKPRSLPCMLSGRGNCSPWMLDLPFLPSRHPHSWTGFQGPRPVFRNPALRDKNQIFRIPWICPSYSRCWSSVGATYSEISGELGQKLNVAYVDFPKEPFSWLSALERLLLCRPGSRKD